MTSNPQDSVLLPYRDRAAGGRALASRLAEYADLSGVLVLALPRGGVPVGFEVAHALNAPLDVFVVRKLGVPGHEELAMGAIASGGIRVLDPETVRTFGISPEVIEQITSSELRELARRERMYRQDRPPPEFEGQTIILVDDGLATGSTMLAAVRALRVEKPARLLVGVPVASAETCSQFQGAVDEIVCVATPRPFIAVGLWYENFLQTSDAEVRSLLTRAAHEDPVQ